MYKSQNNFYTYSPLKKNRFNFFFLEEYIWYSKILNIKNIKKENIKFY